MMWYLLAAWTMRTAHHLNKSSLLSVLNNLSIWLFSSHTGRLHKGSSSRSRVPRGCREDMHRDRHSCRKVRRNPHWSLLLWKPFMAVQCWKCVVMYFLLQDNAGQNRLFCFNSRGRYLGPWLYVSDSTLMLSYARAWRICWKTQKLWLSWTLTHSRFNLFLL